LNVLFFFAQLDEFQERYRNDLELLRDAVAVECELDVNEVTDLRDTSARLNELVEVLLGGV